VGLYVASIVAAHELGFIDREETIARIRGPLETVWERTQSPQQHQRWDLRFSQIDYLPRPDPSKPQRFRYATRIGFGLTIAGEGESVGERHAAEASATSALSFWSDDLRSLIRTGSGYWRYVPTPDGLRFLTRYDYEPRFGPAGKLVDRLLFRPLIGWATAWSFDRLRLWVEQGLDPGTSLRLALAQAAARLALGFTWLYQGIVPKLLFQDSGELAILGGSGLLQGGETAVLLALGWLEVLLGLWLLVDGRGRLHLLLTLQALPLLAVGALVSQPAIFLAPFNPAALTIAMVALAVVALLLQPLAPSAARCLRQPPNSS
jgi:hypothetical protein